LFILNKNWGSGEFLLIKLPVLAILWWSFSDSNSSP